MVSEKTAAFNFRVVGIKKLEDLRLNFKRRIKSHLPYEGIIRSSPYSTSFQDKG